VRVVSVVFLSFRIAATLWIAAIGVFAGLQTLDYIKPAPKLEPVAWGISLGIIGLESIGAILRDRFERNRARLKVDLDKAALVFVLEQLRDPHQGLDLAFEDLGVSVWVPTLRSRVLGKLRWLPREKYQLKRLNRFRPDDYPQSSGISWTGSIGSLGKCWTTMKADYHNGYRIAVKWGSVEITEKAFGDISAKTRGEFTREQFSRIVGKYSEIRAIPIMHSDVNNGSMIGVLTIDRVYDPAQTNFIPRLDRDSTLRRGVAAASLVSSTLASKQ